jgi:hypothetical protein
MWVEIFESIRGTIYGPVEKSLLQIIFSVVLPF